MLEKHYSVAEFCEAIGISRTTHWRMVRAGLLPPPVRLSPGRVGRPESEIAAYLANCPRSRSGRAP
jgi:predicted DNA-binding transcriptional regulator AlpA